MGRQVPCVHRPQALPAGHQDQEYRPRLASGGSQGEIQLPDPQDPRQSRLCGQGIDRVVQFSICDANCDVPGGDRGG